MYLFIAADKGEPPISYAPEHFKTKVFFQTFFMQVPKRAQNHQLFSFSFVQIGAIRNYWERGASRQRRSKMEYSRRIENGSNGYVELVVSANGRRCYRAVSWHGEGSSQTYPEDMLVQAKRYAECD
jgi:hypothetical protein